ncbi:MAG: DUF1549 and DUF1553 domain-containing protein [Planctomycetota bacterium]|nr:DUF1549 and DUF1553 domain-containing protein [Planctomycetota bacterium]
MPCTSANSNPKQSGIASFGLAMCLAAPLLAQTSRTQHWSFHPVQTTERTTGQITELAEILDTLISKRRTAANLTSSPPADRHTLIRRLYLDVHGLPPTTEQIASFVSDEQPDAYARLVDQVLTSPRYGERWAQHWLDIVRYADTTGFEVNTPRATAWPYRDWVIRSLNNDLPYDKFVFEQIAGNAPGSKLVHDHVAATGFLVAGPAVLVGQIGKDEPSRRQAQQDRLDEIIKATGSTFLGLTVGCARCHDHKFDPVSQKDYYAMQAVFAGVRYEQRPIPKADNTHQLANIQAHIASLQQQLDAFEPIAIVSQSGKRASKQSQSTPPVPQLRRPVTATRNIERLKPIEARFLRFKVLATNSGHEPCIDELEVYSATSDTSPSKNVALASAGARATSSGNYANNPKHRLPHIHDNKYGNGRSWISNTKGSGWVVIEFANQVIIDRVVWGRDRNRRFSDRLATQYEIAVANEPGKWQIVSTSSDRSSGKSAPPHPNVQAKNLTRDLGAAESKFAALTKQSFVFAGQFTPNPKPAHFLYRGNPMAPREVITPAIPSVFGAPRITHTVEHERRAAFARWITSEDNPLTSRVISNRIWQHHFGIGLVDTPSDFGAAGQKPSHPKLLNWMARVLMDSNWSLKHLHRIILSSATYRQGSQPRSNALRTDSTNRLLWRFTPRRLEAEVIRDSVLASSGALDFRMGGPGFSLFVPNTNYVRVYVPKTKWTPDTFRRMIYAHKVRMEQGGVFGAFDCPDAGQMAPKRSRSTTALQSLNLFNSTFIIQQAEILARDIDTTKRSNAARVRQAFRRVLGRVPSDSESRKSTDLVAKHGLSALCRVLFNTNEFLVLP